MPSCDHKYPWDPYGVRVKSKTHQLNHSKTCWMNLCTLRSCFVVRDSFGILLFSFKVFERQLSLMFRPLDLQSTSSWPFLALLPRQKSIWQVIAPRSWDWMKFVQPTLICSTNFEKIFTSSLLCKPPGCGGGFLLVQTVSLFFCSNAASLLKLCNSHQTCKLLPW